MSDNCLCDFTPDGVLCSPCEKELGLDSFDEIELDEEWQEW